MPDVEEAVAGLFRVGNTLAAAMGARMAAPDKIGCASDFPSELMSGKSADGEERRAKIESKQEITG
jgi:hypothetical protein